ncbi:hypothetical protein BC938DRAFT_471880 [Jimgerdemannia flammicorona]|uniref:Uncharacterized protein n=1 Tax=Jimgerdemannia flammicorona TaxID=994334 RepID=A0A433QUI6_9FUNG|nr:hypothetical protein BC938DRAFT_471880 [Jimgerdemannia flammicorona]
MPTHKPPSSWQRWGAILASRRWNPKYHALNTSSSQLPIANNPPHRRMSLRYCYCSLLLLAILSTVYPIYSRVTQYLHNHYELQPEDEWIITIFPEVEAQMRAEWAAAGRTWPKHNEKPDTGPIYQLWNPLDQYACRSHAPPLSLLRTLMYENLPDADADRRERHLANSDMRDPSHGAYVLLHDDFTRNAQAELNPGQRFCVRVVVPPPRDPAILNDPARSAYVPHPGSLWDSIMMHAESRTVNLSVSLTLRQWDGHRRVWEKIAGETAEAGTVPVPHELVSRNATHVYEVDMKLIDPGRYQIVTRLEYVDGRWNFENAPIVAYIPDLLPTPHGFSITVAPGPISSEALRKLPEEPETQDEIETEDDEGLSVTSAPASLGTSVTSIPASLGASVTSAPSSLGASVTSVPSSLGANVTSAPASLGASVPADVQSYLNHFNLPLCTRADHPGRWLKLHDFPQHIRDEADPAGLMSDGSFWAPYSCQLRRYSYAEFTRCISRRYPLMHWFGDSNMRRALKKFITGGEWCSSTDQKQRNEGGLRACECEDYMEEGWNETLLNAGLRMNVVELTNEAQADKELDDVGGTPWDKEGLDEEGKVRSMKSEIWYYKWEGLTALGGPPWDGLFEEFPNATVLLQQVNGLKLNRAWMERWGVTPEEIGLEEVDGEVAMTKRDVDDAASSNSEEGTNTKRSVGDGTEAPAKRWMASNNGIATSTTPLHLDPFTNETIMFSHPRDGEEGTKTKRDVDDGMQENLLKVPNALTKRWMALNNRTTTSTAPPHSGPFSNEPMFPHLSLHKRWYLTLAPPQLLIVSLGNWDAAWMPFEDFVRELERLVAYLRQRYVAYGVPILYRSAQYFCCHIDESEHHRKFSTSRVQAYDRVAKEVLARRVGAKGWDVYALGEQRAWVDKLASVGCSSNHAPPDLVEAENQVLMNGLCNVGWFDEFESDG